MIADARTVVDGSIHQTDVCIVGAGAAGITVAKALIDSPLDVCLLEAGGFALEKSSQALYRGENAGLPYFALDETRFRQFGGSTNRWAGWCRPLDPIDFERRPWVPHSGWPFTFSELTPYYVRARRLCELPEAGFDPGEWHTAVPEIYRLSLSDRAIRTVLWHGSPPTKFGLVYRRELQQAANLRAYLHANVVEIETNPTANSVTRLRVKSDPGTEFYVSARVVVLAAGAIETTRLLLASNRTQPAGLGNQYDLVGRYFIEHPHLVTGRVVLSGPAVRRRRIAAIDRGITGAWARLRLRRPSRGIKCAYTVDEAVQRREGLLNYSAHLSPVSRSVPSDSDVYTSLRLIVSNMRSVRKIAGQLRHRRLPEGLAHHVRNVLTNPTDVARATYEELIQRPTELAVYTQSEAAPNPDSRITLARECDPLGVPRVRLDWRLNAIDQDSVRRSQVILGEALEQVGIGRIEMEPWLAERNDAWGPDLQGGHHHLGTARMSADPKTGVVDPHLRVHGIANLFIADSSVFPTAGFANPMLTIVALAQRLADRLKVAFG